MPAYNTLAIVIRRLNYGETDKIITLYSREHGRIPAIAKGARKAISRLSGATEVLTCTQFQLATGKSMEIVAQCEVQESFTMLRQNLSKLAHGLYFADLIDHVVEDREPNPVLFDLLLAGLKLVQALADPELAARWFELQLLADLGYAPQLADCGICHEALPGIYPEDEVYALSASSGSALCPRHAHPGVYEDHTGLTWPAMAFLTALEAITPGDLSSLASIMLPDQKSMDQARMALRRHLRYRLDRDLKSLEFLDSLRYGSV